MARHSLLFLSVLFILISSIELVPLNKRIINFDHPQIVHFPSVSHDHLTSRSIHPDRVRLSFYAFDQLFDLDLEPNSQLLEGSIFYYAQENGELVPQTPNAIAYQGVSVDTRVTFHDIDAKLFEGYVQTETELYLFFPATHEQVDETVRDTFKSNMLVVRHSDIIEDADAPPRCGHKDEPFHERSLITRQSSNFDQPLLDPLPVTCPATQKRLIVGVVTDRSYETKYPSTQSQIVAHLNSLSGVYVKHTNIVISLGNAYVGLRNYVTDTCLDTCSNALGNFSDFRATLTTDKAGLFALFTNCNAWPDAAGMAWVGTVCNTGRYGTSVNSMGFGDAHLLLAHEMGHNFGANHDPVGGIMYSYVTGSTLFSRQSQSSLCDGYSKQQTNTQCFFDSVCTPSCPGVCGPNGCGGTCGSCPSGQVCSNSTCIVPCQPNCQGKQCGDDGCGGSCGQCAQGACSSNVCVCSSCPTNWSGNIWLTMHNDIRNKYRVANYTWSTTMLNTANNWTNSCTWGTWVSTSFGTTIYALWGYQSEPAFVLQDWVDQEKNWNCSTDTCAAGASCGDFRKMIWSSTTEFACSTTLCDPSVGVSPWPGQAWTYLVCLYNPRGGSVSVRPVPLSNCPNSCTPSSTCVSKGFNCGSFVDECGTTVNCGTCSSSSTCQSNKCVCTPSTSCGSSPTTQCGSIQDGCGKTLNCGTCTAPFTCVGGTCICQPNTSCQLQNKNCGVIADDGCGNSISCGECGANSICQNGVCTVTCTPTRTCASEGATCGQIDSGCGMISCGSCSSSSPSIQCVSGSCVCVPTSTCSSTGRQCGDLFDGCTTQNCGVCTGFQQCQSGRCVGCSTCSQFATCNSNLQCVCNGGYTGDGTTCTPIPDIPTPSGPGNWQVVEGTGWVLGSKDIQFPSVTTQDSAIYWSDVQNIPFETTRKFAVLLRRQPDTPMIGVTFNTNPTMYYFFRWYPSGSSGRLHYGKKSRSTPTSTTWNTLTWSSRTVLTMPANVWHQWVVDISGSLVSLNVSTPTSWFRLSVNFGGTGGITNTGVGLTARGPAEFTNATFVSQTTVIISLVSCVSETELRNSIARVLNVDPSTIGPIDINCGKRQEVVTASVTLYSVPGGPGSGALATTLQTYIANGHRSLSAVGLSATSATLVAEPINPEGYETIQTGGSSGGSSGVGPEVYVPIIVCGSVAVLALIGAVVYMKNRENDSSSSNNEMTPMEKRGGKPASTRSPNTGDENILYDQEGKAPEPGVLPSSSSGGQDNRPKAAVDVIGRDAEHASITARAPGVKS